MAFYGGNSLNVKEKNTHTGYSVLLDNIFSNSILNIFRISEISPDKTQSPSDASVMESFF